ncbi:MAG TPA: hypothetical protein VIH57_17330 [Bacteroidales bacterium]
MKREVNIRKSIRAIIIISIVVVLALVVNNIYAQQKDKEGNPKSGSNQPQVNVKVDKQRDKNGNIIRYDSTYTWSWNGNGNIPENVDSMMKSMHSRFAKGFKFNDKSSGISNDFFNDSAFIGDNFEGMFDKDFGNLDKMLSEQQKMMQKYFKGDFNDEPMLKVPDGVTPETPKAAPKKEQKQLKEQKKQQPLIKDDEAYSTQI